MILAFTLTLGSTAVAQNAIRSKYETAATIGQAAPESGLTLGAFSNVVLEDEAHLAFESFLSGSVGSNNDQAFIRMFQPSTPMVEAGQFSGFVREGTTINDAQLSMNIANRQLSLTQDGQLAFNCNLSGTGGTSNDTGLYHYSFGGTVLGNSQLTEMAREGNIAPGGAGGTLQNFGTGILDVQFRGVNTLGRTYFQDIIPDSPGGFLDDSRCFEVSPIGLPVARGVEGGPAPGGGQFSLFSGQEFNNVGDILVTGSVTMANIGNKIWHLDSSGNFTQLIHVVVTGGTSTPVGSLRSTSGIPMINDLGTVAFVGWTSAGGTGSSDTYVMQTNKTAAPVSVLLSEGTLVPNGNGVVDNISIGVARFNNRGQHASGLSLRSTTGGTSDNTGIFRVDSNGSLVQLFRKGQPAISGNGTFGDLGSFTQFAFNDAGVAAMLTNYVGTTGGAADNTAIVVTDGIDYFEVAREGVVVGNSTVASLLFSNGVVGNDTTTDGINQYGQLAYVQRLLNNTQSIQIWTPDLYYRGGPSGSFNSHDDWTLSLTPYRVHDTYVVPTVNTIVNTGGDNLMLGDTVLGGDLGSVEIQPTGSNNLVQVFGQLLLHSNATIGPDIDIQADSLYGEGRILSLAATDSVAVFESMSPGLPAQSGRLEIRSSLHLNGTTYIELGGEDLGEFDQVYGLNGDVELANSLSVSLIGGFQLAPSMSFIIFDINQGSVVSTFNGLGEGASVGNFDGQELFITYAGGDGNDIELYTTPIDGYVFHAGSAFENSGVQAALDLSKSLARETSESQTLNYNNLINSSRGINGLVFEVVGVPATLLTASDFIFQVSPQGAFNLQQNPPAAWSAAPVPASIEVEQGTPDRIILRWADNAIANRWLRVTLLANANTGLGANTTFYIGHLLGETTGEASGGIHTVAFADISPIRGAIGQTVDASSPFDINKNGTVAFGDISEMRLNIGAQLSNITVP